MLWTISEWRYAVDILLFCSKYEVAADAYAYENVTAFTTRKPTNGNCLQSDVWSNLWTGWPMQHSNLRTRTHQFG